MDLKIMRKLILNDSISLPIGFSEENLELSFFPFARKTTIVSKLGGGGEGGGSGRGHVLFMQYSQNAFPSKGRSL